MPVYDNAENVLMEEWQTREYKWSWGVEIYRKIQWKRYETPWYDDGPGDGQVASTPSGFSFVEGRDVTKQKIPRLGVHLDVFKKADAQWYRASDDTAYP